jgi:hypothetical protein
VFLLIFTERSRYCIMQAISFCVSHSFTRSITAHSPPSRPCLHSPQLLREASCAPHPNMVQLRSVVLPRAAPAALPLSSFEASLLSDADPPAVHTRDIFLVYDYTSFDLLV